MKLQKNLFDLTSEQLATSKMMYNKTIKCLIAPYHTEKTLEIEQAPNIMMFPERELTHQQTKSFISMCVNSPMEEILIITTSVDIIYDMVDDCVRILTEFDTLVESPEKTFAANQHTIIHTILNNENHQKSESEKTKSHDDINKVISLINGDKKLTKKQIEHCRNVISKVGEPIIYNRLENMLNNKI